MEHAAFPPTEGLFTLVDRAYDAVHRLRIHVHYMTCDGVGEHSRRAGGEQDVAGNVYRGAMSSAAGAAPEFVFCVFCELATKRLRARRKSRCPAAAVVDSDNGRHPQAPPAARAVGFASSQRPAFPSE